MVEGADMTLLAIKSLLMLMAFTIQVLSAVSMLMLPVNIAS